MQPVLSLVLAAGLALAATPGEAGTGTGQEGARAAPSLAQNLTDRGAARSETRGGDDGGLRGLTDRLLDFFSDERPPTTERGCVTGSCPSGTQCCCCGNECYCKRECSLKRCR
jgi:hypothetical protein